jgi:endonuclease III
MTTIETNSLQEKRSKIITAIERILDLHFPPPIPVPLNHASEFQFLSAVSLSAQTTDISVNRVTKILWERAPTPEATLLLSQEEVEGIIQSLGFYKNKAKNLLLLSKQLVEKYGGVVPVNKTDLIGLAGVGNKTASVYLSQMHGIPSMAVDTHVHRLALRWGLTKEAKDPNKVQADLERLFPERSWSKIHLQMIYFGREYCPAKMHTNKDCPICSIIHSTDTKKLELSSPVSPSKLKQGKNILFYKDRIKEIDEGAVVTSPKVGSVEKKKRSIVEHDEEKGVKTRPVRRKLNMKSEV